MNQKDKGLNAHIDIPPNLTKSVQSNSYIKSRVIALEQKINCLKLYFAIG